jgi:hypothetical protein
MDPALLSKRAPVTLRELPCETSIAELPERALDFLGAVEERRRALVEQKDALLGFVPSDCHAAYATLLALRKRGGVERFCEWGSGLGSVTGLAALLGYESVGIEIQPALVDASRALLAEYELDATVLEGSFIPESYDTTEHGLGGEMVTVLTGAGTRDDVDVDIDEFDLLFAFPWPGEEALYFDVFDRFAASGALLATYHGPCEGMQLRRKR